MSGWDIVIIIIATMLISNAAIHYGPLGFLVAYCIVIVIFKLLYS